MWEGNTATVSGQNRSEGIDMSNFNFAGQRPASVQFSNVTGAGGRIVRQGIWRTKSGSAGKSGVFWLTQSPDAGTHPAKPSLVKKGRHG